MAGVLVGVLGIAVGIKCGNVLVHGAENMVPVA